MKKSLATALCASILIAPFAAHSAGKVENVKAAATEPTARQSAAPQLDRLIISYVSPGVIMLRTGDTMAVCQIEQDGEGGSEPAELVFGSEEGTAVGHCWSVKR